MPTFSELVENLKSWFIYPNTPGDYIFYGVVIAVVIGAIWLLSHWPPLYRRPWLWAVAVGSALVTMLGVVFLEYPLRKAIEVILERVWDQATLSDWLLLSLIPAVLVIGLVQEGFKMLPVVFWWWRSDRKISPKMGMAIGALAGAGFGVFEALHVYNQIYLNAIGLPWDAARYGFEGISPYWESFFSVGFHIAASALAGYGLAKGKGFNFYLLVALMNALITYGILLRIDLGWAELYYEIYVAALSALFIAWVLWLRWRKADDEPEEQAEPVEPAETVEAVEEDV